MGFGFLVPIVFVAGAGLLLAVAFTYLLKPSRPSRRVSSTLLWMAAYHELQARKPWRRVPPSLLLLLQILALAAIVAALARPYVLSAEATGPDGIVLLDVSASMQATDIAPSRFEAARARVAELIDALEPDQTLALVSLGAEPRLVAPRTSDRDLLHRALSSLQPSTQAANLPAALSLAASLADGRPETLVFVVGDGAIDRSQIPADLPFTLRSITVGGAADNLAIAAFGTRDLNGRLAALGRVTNYGSQRRTATLDLRVDGTRFDARFLAIEPGASADAQWDDLPQSARVLEARLVESDALALDNTAWAVVGGDRATRILLVSEANIFLERALALRPNVQLTRVDPAAYAPEEVRAQPFDLIVFDSFLPAVLPDSGSLFLIHPPPGSTLVRTRGEVLVSRLSPARERPSVARRRATRRRARRTRAIDRGSAVGGHDPRVTRDSPAAGRRGSQPSHGGARVRHPSVRPAAPARVPDLDAASAGLARARWQRRHPGDPRRRCRGDRAAA